MGWTHSTNVKGNAYSILVGLVYTVQMGLKEVGSEYLDWVMLAPHRVTGRLVWTRHWNFGFHKMHNFLSTWTTHHFSTILIHWFNLLLFDSSVGIALGYRWMIGVLGFDSRRGLGIFVFTTASRTALGPTQTPIQCVLGTLSLGIKRPGREADDSLPLMLRSKNEWSYTSTPPICLHGVVLS
jgi:hypothetical protein